MAGTGPVDSLLARLAQMAPYAPGVWANDLCLFTTQLTNAVIQERWYYIQSSVTYNQFCYGVQLAPAPLLTPYQMYPVQQMYFGPVIQPISFVQPTQSMQPMQPMQPIQPMRPTPRTPPQADETRITEVEQSQTPHPQPNSDQPTDHEKNEEQKESESLIAQPETTATDEQSSAADTPTPTLGTKAEPDTVNENEDYAVIGAEDSGITRYAMDVETKRELPKAFADVLAARVRDRDVLGKRKSSQEMGLEPEQPARKAVKMEAGEEPIVEQEDFEEGHIKQEVVEE